MQKFRRAVVEKRFQRGLRQYDLSKRICVDQSVLSRIENGQRDATPEVAAALVRYFRSEALGRCYCDECPVMQAMRGIKLTRLNAA